MDTMEILNVNEFLLTKDARDILNLNKSLLKI